MVWRVWSFVEAAYTPPFAPGMNPLFAEQYKSISRKNARAGRGTRWHILGADRAALAQITHRNASVGDLRGFGQTGDLDGGTSRSIAKFEATRVLLVHDAHRNCRG